MPPSIFSSVANTVKSVVQSIQKSLQSDYRKTQQLLDLRARICRMHGTERKPGDIIRMSDKSYLVGADGSLRLLGLNSDLN